LEPVQVGLGVGGLGGHGLALGRGLGHAGRKALISALQVLVIDAQDGRACSEGCAFLGEDFHDAA